VTELLDGLLPLAPYELLAAGASYDGEQYLNVFVFAHDSAEAAKENVAVSTTSSSTAVPSRPTDRGLTPIGSMDVRAEDQLVIATLGLQPDESPTFYWRAIYDSLFMME
jgi:hypothetical protein